MKKLLLILFITPLFGELSIQELEKHNADVIKEAEEFEKQKRIIEEEWAKFQAEQRGEEIKDEVATTSSNKPNIDDTLKKIYAVSAKYDKNILSSEALLYLSRWFNLASQVKSSDESSIYYVLPGSLINTKIGKIEEFLTTKLIFDYDDLESTIREEVSVWRNYLSNLIQDFGNLEEKFNSRSRYVVTPYVGLNLRENPLTGTENVRKKLLPGGKIVYVLYFIKGAGKEFSGEFKNHWAKVVVKYRNRKVKEVPGWVSMRYLRGQ
jgi:hypothetical protein